MVRNILLLVILFSSIKVSCQISASTTVESRATIIDPIKITKSVDLDFGNVISAYTPGRVVLLPEGSRIADGVQISNTFPGNVSPAQAEVIHGNNKYSITLPESFLLYSQDDPNQILLIDEFKVVSETGELIDILNIGATLNLAANQPSGFYTNTSGFYVTVSYN